MFSSLLICLSVCPSVCLSCLSACRLSVCPFVCQHYYGETNEGIFMKIWWVLTSWTQTSFTIFFFFWGGVGVGAGWGGGGVGGWGVGWGGWGGGGGGVGVGGGMNSYLLAALRKSLFMDFHAFFINNCGHTCECTKSPSEYMIFSFLSGFG